MILYHIDRNQFCQPGQIIHPINDCDYCSYLKKLCFEQYNGNLSVHGINYLITNFAFENPTNKTCTIFELIFELIRIQFFPDKPSRFQCFFGCDSDSINYWLNIFNDSNNPFPIYEIEVENCIKMDSKFISNEIIDMNDLDGKLIPDFPTDISIVKLAYQAYHYWSGSKTDNPLFEYLISSPFKVKSRIR